MEQNWRAGQGGTAFIQDEALEKYALEITGTGELIGLGTYRNMPEGVLVYDTIADTSSDWIDTLDRKLDIEQFCDSLIYDQQDLIRMLRDGIKISEITDFLGISERNIRLMAYEIAQLRRKFETES